MKTIFTFLFLAFTITSLYSQKYFTRTGKIDFNASVKGFEAVEATNNSSTAILNITTGDLAILSLVKGFKFDIALMQEHFNERYIESHKFPKSTFKGKIVGFKPSLVNSKSKNFTLKGKLTLHGVTKSLQSTAKIKKVKNQYIVYGSFSVNATDFGIKIGSAVSKKVTNKVNIKYEFKLNKK